MKTVGFVGAYPKTDILLYIAKIATVLKNKVLIIDTTIDQKAKYIIPTISQTEKYITEYKQIDIAIGFENIEEIKQYVGITEKQQLEYDLVLIDIDTSSMLNNFIKNNEKIFFVTSFDIYSLKRGLESFSNLQEKKEVVRVLFSRDMSYEEDDYLNLLAKNYKIKWDGDKIYFPYCLGDECALMDNQRINKLLFRNLSNQYKFGILVLALNAIENSKEINIKKAMKIIDKGEE